MYFNGLKGSYFYRLCFFIGNRGIVDVMVVFVMGKFIKYFMLYVLFLCDNL